ncbi:MAG: hypothetical protein FXV79_05335 [Candidatus Thioglobus sp.]|nr:MAG: hypothetical protein FXV79_05335 [Candidatus Thioglobus sp.]
MAKSKLIEMQAQNETILTLKILSKATDKLSAEIASLVSKNKTKFKRKAVILEIENQHFQANELAVLMEILTQNQLVAIGIRSSVQELIDFADISGLAIFDKPTLTPTKPKETQQSQAQQPKHRLPKIVVGGVHTSEQALSKDSDLVLLGSVETGADVIAHGSISAYQEMNGRAFAGIDGDEKFLLLAFIRNLKSLCPSCTITR